MPLEKTEKQCIFTGKTTKRARKMANILIGIIATAILAACIFGWPGLLSVAFICLGCYICKDRREKPGAILSFIEKIGK